jgi:hypothetical protein
MSSAHELTAQRPRAPALAVPAIAPRHAVVVAVLALAALTFLMPSAPTYDPWAWIIWGREILHLDLSTVQGPSWKPLPVLLTTPFALFGSAAPNLWLFVARAAAIAGIVMVFRVGRRLGGLPAGAGAAAAYAIAPWTIHNGLLGNSEGMLVALVLGAVDRHMAGRARQAFALGVGAALLRPEAWPFLVGYGVWLVWRERAAWPLVVAGFASLPLLWLLPEGLGSGDPLRAMHRAQDPGSGSPAFALDPVNAVVRQFVGMFTTPVWCGLALLVVLALLGHLPGRREGRLAAALCAGAFVWVMEVAYMTSSGFSGNERYLILPAALTCVLAGAGLGWALRSVSGRARPSLALAPLAVVAAFGFAWPSVKLVGPELDTLRYQAHLSDGLAGAIASAGGPDRLKACGPPYAGPFQVPVVAWRMHLHTSQVIDAKKHPLQAPAVVFRVRTTPLDRPQPSLDPLGGEAAVTTLGSGSGWRIVGRCR